MASTRAAVQDAADALFAARTENSQVPPLRDRFDLKGGDDAYAVQNINTERWIKQGRRPVGRKIGLTSKAVQQQIGVAEPDYGILWADYAFQDGDTLQASRFMQPRAEVEIAFVIGRSLPDPAIEMTSLISAIAYALPSVEIVDSAIKDWDIRLVDTIADNASAGGFILGIEPKKIDALDLRLCGALLSVNGAVASTGVGAACLGHPLNAALWLARKMAEVGRPLGEGDVVLSGALGPLVNLSRGDVAVAEIQGFSPLKFAIDGK
ncbi:2-keto-4-pentenoate hydratase [Aminobacter aminovorans]|uniref:2-keto-4-pentenoate hydratase n=1 Tax=Aminobacter aminovorans TaxID=83263 RepID=A0ABR6HDK6_AMIAI|nr:fumarylacetoacetate hydrolase family protein [Aminobacter aminovorans]MBB3708600.1 2-keto-4-pentenoate hydratase [Aminobacter aminovorans]